MNRRSLSFWIRYLAAAGILMIVVMEVVVRLLGYTTWNPSHRVDIQVEPGGKLFQTDKLLGYKHLPGAFHVTLPTGLEFDVRHGEDTYRITRPMDSYLEDEPRPEVWIFGGSFVHGWSLEDHETFPWLLQDRFPDNNFINFGVGGYGTIQTLLQIEQLLAEGRTAKAIVIAYSALHDERNTLLRSRMKEVYAWNHLGDMSQPAARLNNDGELVVEHRGISYRAVPLVRYSVLAHCIDMAINKLQKRIVNSGEITEAILENILSHGRAHEIPVVIAHIYEGPDSRDLIQTVRDMGVETVDISVDLQQPGMSNRPYDAHPGALANRHYADALGDYLVSTELLAE